MSINQYNLAGLIAAPVVSEKSTIAAENNKTFVFKVNSTANKANIKNSVELMFGVKVDTVHVLNVKGKIKKSGRTIGKRSDWKKAYVKLKSGFDIEYVGS